MALIAILWSIGVFSLLLLTAVQPLSWVAVAAGCLGIVLCGALALRGWQRAAVGMLHWDGAHWHWDGFADISACTLVLRLDLQSLLLVTVASPAGRHVWLWLTRQSADAQWRALRRAVVA